MHHGDRAACHSPEAFVFMGRGPIDKDSPCLSTEMRRNDEKRDGVSDRVLTVVGVT